LEIYDITLNTWTLFTCNDGAIIRCSYLGASTFLDPDSGANDEKIVIFGGQSIESEA